jgi:hypothetical protein
MPLRTSFTGYVFAHPSNYALFFRQTVPGGLIALGGNCTKREKR